MSQWRTGLPENSELEVVFRRDDNLDDIYEVLGGNFIVWDGARVDVWGFQRPPHPQGGWYTGYWVTEREPVAWMPLPKPPGPGEL